MRTRAVLIAVAIVIASAAATAARADDPQRAAEVVVRIAQPPALSQGNHASLRVEVELSPNVARPLLLTPHVEGQPIEVVKGRLLRADAHDADASTLIFDLPVRVLGPGTAVVHVEVSAYACAQRCRLVEARTKRVLNVSL